MKTSILKVLFPASVLAFLAGFVLPSLRADDAAVPTVGAVTDTSAPSLDSIPKDTGSDAPKPAAAKGAKKKHGKKKHGKKTGQAPANADQAAAAHSDAAPAADAGK